MLMENQEIQNEFILKIDFEKGSMNPENVFKSMAEMIDAFHSIDMTLIKMFDLKVEPYMVLQDVEQGSIRTKLCTLLKAVDDEAIRELDWKKLIGSFLVKAKYRLIEKLETKNETLEIEQIRDIEKDIYSIAEDTGLNYFQNYKHIDTRKLLIGISKLANGASLLNKNDEIIYISEFGEVTIRKGLAITPKTIEEIIIHETHISKIEAVVVVKKPDYLGISMWDVQHEGRMISVKIVDQIWLYKFHNREIILLPGDALKVQMSTEISVDERGVVVGEHYIITVVEGVIKAVHVEQETMI